ncbi:MAG: A/G-specific adenine glycosylase [Phycisphaerales bacterium]
MKSLQLPQLTSARALRIASRIETWFAANARDFPWRRKRSGYSALVAEVMLQQTQAARVVPAFNRFMKQFPDAKALAAADEDVVLRAWDGLGYYRRARLLHRAACAIAEEHHGQTPRDADALQRLPGVGRYTAGAIASIVHGERTAIVDGNIMRILARLLAMELPRDHKAAVAWTWQMATQLVKASSSPAVLNEGLMELGAMVCRPKQPLCATCPLATCCRALQLGLERELPVAASRAQRVRVTHHAIVIPRQRDQHILMQQRQAVGLWAHMWQTFTIESSQMISRSQLQKTIRFAAIEASPVMQFVHNTTHREVMFVVHRGVMRRGHRPPRGSVWMPPSSLADLAMGTAQQRLIASCIDATR